MDLKTLTFTKFESLPYCKPLLSASSLRIISPTYSMTKVFFLIVSRALTPQPRPLLVRKMESFNYFNRKMIIVRIISNQ